MASGVNKTAVVVTVPEAYGASDPAVREAVFAKLPGDAVPIRYHIEKAGKVGRWAATVEWVPRNENFLRMARAM